MIRKIDGKTNSIMENGLYRFYQSFSAFLVELRGSKFLEQEDDDAYDAMNMEQLIKPLIHHYGCLAICLGFLLVEIIVHRFNLRRILY